MTLTATPSPDATKQRTVLLAACIGVLITSSLGIWQLSRAAQKDAIAASMAEREKQATLGNADVINAGSKQEVMMQTHYRRAQLKGHWLNQHTVFLDNRQMQGHVGFFVLTPFKLSDNGDVLLVQRGWVPRQFNDRNALPDIAAPADEQSVTVLLTPPPARLYQFKGEDKGKIRQNVDMNAFAAELNMPLLLLSAQQIADTALKDGLLRDWPRVNTGVEKHYGYAFQWFGLAVLIAVLTLWFQFIKPKRMRNTS